ncbi:MAG: hypothetical protein H6Q48_409 [Deltaproteobacteria bacterium]|nr:hypothetical protein [Deltaproteobacteria bacterium]
MITNQIRQGTLRQDVCLPLLFFALISLVMVGPHVLPPTQITRFGYAPQDSYIFLWDFWWTKQAVLALKNPYWTDLLFYPSGTTLTFHTYPLAYGLFSLPFQLIAKGTAGLVVAFNTVIFLSFVLSGFGAYRLAVYLTGSTPAGLLAGLMYAFIPFHLINMVSLNLLAMEFLPFFVLALLRLKEKPTFPAALTAAVWLALTYYSSLEYALFLLLFSGICLIYLTACLRREITWSFVGFLGVALALFAILASPQLYQQIRVYFAPEFNAEMGLDQAALWSPALLSLFTPTRFHPIYGQAMSFAGDLSSHARDSVGMRSEATLGFVTWGLAILGFLRAREDKSVFWVFAGICFIGLTLGPYLRVTGKWLSGIPMPYLLLHQLLPPLRASRDPTRFIPLVALSLSVLAAFGARRCLAYLDRSFSRMLLTVLLGSLILFEYLPGGALKSKPSMHPAYREISQHDGDFAVMDLTREPFGLVQQIFHGKKITSFPKTIPRSPSHRSTLALERDFRSPEKFLNLEPAIRSERLELHKSEIDIFRIRYAVLSPSPKLELQMKLAALLGARMEHVHGLVRCEFMGDRLNY